ncbi:MAG: SIMPL domain-containing protein [Pirellulales bacterium]|nr:SIMPL domain-containing protein [Pirellulales bacterium]
MNSCKVSVALLCVFMVGLVMFSGTGRAVAEEPMRKVTVSARADVDVVPDEVLLKFHVVSKDKDLMKAKAKNDAVTKAVLALAPKHDIPEKQFTMTDLDMGPDYERRGPNRDYVFVGYVVSRTIEVSIRDFTKMEPVLADAIKAGVTRADDLLFRTRKPREYYFEVRRLAVKYAKEKAAHLAKLNGLRLGQALEIEDQAEHNEHTWGMACSIGSLSQKSNPGRFRLVGDQQPPTSDKTPPAKQTKKTGDSGPNLLAPGTITLSTTVSIVFEMLPPAR